MLSVTLRRLIDQKLTTAREIGELTGTAPSTVYRWIRGEAQPSFDTIRLLMRHLRNREAQAALLGTFTASTPWRFYTADVEAEISREGAVDLREAMESTLDTIRSAAQAMAEIRDTARERTVNEGESEQLVQQTNNVIRSCSILQRVVQNVAEQRRTPASGAPGSPGTSGGSSNPGSSAQGTGQPGGPRITRP